MECDFHKGDYLRWHQVHEQIGKVSNIDTFSSTLELTDKDGTCFANIEDFEPIPTGPDVLEAFGFNEGVLNNIAQPCWIMWWLETDMQTSIEVWPEKFQDTGGNGWICRINRQLNHCQVQVKNINDIQHAMRVTGITKELEYNPR